MSESRTELIAWLNDLLKLNYTKVEQCGTGAALCQIIDSIYPGTVHLSRVKFNANQEFEYIQNFKILQAAFQKNNIDKNIPVERLVKCRFQDNLEFLQWMKKYWDTYYSGEEYDAISRRNSSPMNRRGLKDSALSSRKTSVASTTTKRTVEKKKIPDNSTLSKQNSKVEEYDKIIMGLNEEIEELKLNVDGLEKERNFYFGKLREIEILVQTQLENETESNEYSSVLKDIQTILYSTEEGFEIPENGEAAEGENEEEMF
ncbi:microtubule binding protein [Neocallimastix lanati (nom. inval.)]|jgi:RP/EB family microtubule-associated protein|uniref:Microtubule binding protein n=1 Tax=Neocallimastix californiae TaxID=1754190 RepID=A0A1Y2CJ94_9FUNG|nr:microtubule binding protein [Neocallimastix sp. JGI-2020a]ORY47112.1 microtubule binding protein [Neocallimastix californiae]|eukprot:ORY47112.1 microtubule binding protein [Neocallimastix californiae]